MREHYEDEVLSKRLSLMDGKLTAQDKTCQIEALGVLHDGKPRTSIIDATQSADVVTLELTRGVVKAGLNGEDIQILARNPFWGGLITSLRERQDEQLIRGVEVNQGSRFAFKRYQLHHDSPTLAASICTIEVEPDNIPHLNSVLTAEEIARLQKFKWLVSERDDVVEDIRDKVWDAVQKKKKDPRQLTDEMRLVCYKADERESEKQSITFMTPPDPTVLETGWQLYQYFKTFSVFNDQEAANFSYEALSTYFFSPAELSESREISYFANQRINQNRKERAIRVIHIGGGYHTDVIGNLFRNNAPDTSRLTVQDRYEDGLGLGGHVDLFFRDHIPFIDRMKAITVEEYDASLNTDLVMEQVKQAMGNNMADLERRIGIEKQVLASYPTKGKRDLEMSMKISAEIDARYKGLVTHSAKHRLGRGAPRVLQDTIQIQLRPKLRHQRQ